MRSILSRYGKSALYTVSRTRKIHTQDEAATDFLSWLQRKSGETISSVLCIGKSSYGGVGLFAKEAIKTGDCLFKIPFEVQLKAEDFKKMEDNDFDNRMNTALLLMQEQTLVAKGYFSEWAPYIKMLPQLKEMHMPVLWSEEELEMLRPSYVYEETILQKSYYSPHNYPPNFNIQAYKHASLLVCSRAWQDKKLIPFADFANHDGTSRVIVEDDENAGYSLARADRDYSIGEEVKISYGEYSNDDLLMSYGFTFAENPYHSAVVRIDVPDWLTPLLEPQHKHKRWFDFKINGVKLPRELQAFYRKACGFNEGMHGKEIAMNQELTLFLRKKVELYTEYINMLPSPLFLSETSKLRRRCAVDLLRGELRVLKSACCLLEEYCS